MPQDSFPILSALMAPCPPAHFLTDYWPKQPFVTHGPIERLPASMRGPILSSPAALGQGYHGRLRFTHGGSDRMAQLGDVAAAVLQDMGLTVHFVDIGACVPGINELLREFEGELALHQGAMSISAFTAPRDDGLSCHYDAQELVSIQLHGSKNFHYAPMHEIRNPIGTQVTPRGQPFDELFPQLDGEFPDPDRARFSVAPMQPGSVLFLPRGTWHYTQASEHSLSLSIRIDVQPALAALLEQLRLLLLQDADWRQPMYGAGGDARRSSETRASLAKLLDALPSVIAQLSPEDLLESSSGLERRLRRIEGATRFQRTPHTRMTCQSAEIAGMQRVALYQGHTVSLTQLGAEVQVPPSGLELFRWIDAQQGDAFSASHLQRAFPSESPATLQWILALCVKAQFLQLLPYRKL
jgi:ribosomal protein L16 Arg81 hydroxylase